MTINTLSPYWIAWQSADSLEHNGASHTIAGNILRHDFLIPQLERTRRVSVLLPATYEESSKRYPVLYMHDGQNLFDASEAFGGVEWGVDETMATLAEEGIEAIVVGVDHGDENRISEYNPFGRGEGKAYLSWLLGDLKAVIDAEFRTRPERESTFLGGSSMGGLISLYALFHTPQSVGGVIAMSPSLWVHRFAMLDEARRAPLGGVRIYLDHGTKEQTARPMLQALQARGMEIGNDLMFVAEKGATHTESAWARRLPDAVRFLLSERKFTL